MVKPNTEARIYLSRIGSVGGKKSTIAKKQAAKKREENKKKAKKLISEMAKRRGCKCKDLKVVLKKQGIIKK